MSAMTTRIVLTREREAQGMSRSELARRAALNASTVGQIEAGRFIPYPGQLAKLAAALGYEGDPKTLLDEAG